MVPANTDRLIMTTKPKRSSQNSHGPPRPQGSTQAGLRAPPLLCWTTFDTHRPLWPKKAPTAAGVEMQTLVSAPGSGGLMHVRKSSWVLSSTLGGLNVVPDRARSNSLSKSSFTTCVRSRSEPLSGSAPVSGSQ